MSNIEDVKTGFATGSEEKYSDVEQRMHGHVLSAEEAELARLGYKQEFRREFGWLATFSFAFSISGLLATVQVTMIMLKIDYIDIWLSSTCWRSSGHGLVLVQASHIHDLIDRSGLLAARLA